MYENDFAVEMCNADATYQRVEKFHSKLPKELAIVRENVHVKSSNYSMASSNKNEHLNTFSQFFFGFELDAIFNH